MSKRLLSVATRIAALAGLGVALASCQSDQIVYRTQTAIAAPLNGAANFVGYSDPSTKQTVCGNCHVTQQAGWKQTAHASAWSSLTSSGVANTTSCQNCHAVSGKGNMLQNDSVGYAGTHDARYADVQCENCHGQGLDHATSPGLSNRLLASIAVDTGSKNVNGCGECHTGTHEPFVDEWRQSRHSNVEAPALSNYVSGSNTTCVGCHTAQGALAAWGITTNYQERDSLKTHALALTCGVCHDPHQPGTNGKQLRFSLSARDTSQNLCMRCHQRRAVPDVTNTSAPHSAEGPTLLGQAGWIPPNYTGPVLTATHGSEANTNLCATCHVSRFTVNDPKSGAFQFQSTGHLFAAIPCLAPNGQPTTTDCEVTQRTFAACTGSGCHANTNVAQSAYIASDARITQLDSTLSQMLAKVPASEFTTATGKITTARGAKFNLQLAEKPGAAIHNPFLIEALLTSSIKQVQTDYKITPGADIALNNVLGTKPLR